jgi:tRNA-dihydrouridine synthase
MIGRGAIHNPWIFRQSKSFFLKGLSGSDPSLKERIDVLKNHYKYSVEYKGEHKGVLEMRKHISGYLRGLPNISKFRMELMQDLILDQIYHKLDEIYDFYSQTPESINTQPDPLYSPRTKDTEYHCS